jgi:hypothetical protein
VNVADYRYVTKRRSNPPYAVGIQRRYVAKMTFRTTARFYDPPRRVENPIRHLRRNSANVLVGRSPSVKQLRNLHGMSVLVLRSEFPRSLWRDGGSAIDTVIVGDPADSDGDGHCKVFSSLIGDAASQPALYSAPLEPLRRKAAPLMG